MTPSALKTEPIEDSRLLAVPAKQQGVRLPPILEYPFALAERRPEETLLDYGRRIHRHEFRRWKLKHRAGIEDVDVYLLRSLLVDFLLRQIYEEQRGPKTKRSSKGTEPLTLVAIGGYGRREMAPYSDVDLMFLYEARSAQADRQRIQEILCFLWDMGLQVGHSVRTVQDALVMAREDLVSLNSMLDARLIIGNDKLFGDFRQKLRKLIEKEKRALAERLLLSVQERHESQGGTPFIQEPNIKECRGGLRDFHTIQWILKAFLPDLTVEAGLEQQGVSLEEWSQAHKSYQFLKSLRAHLHFLTNRATDTLSHQHLSAVLTYYEYRRAPHQKESEAFLKHYYQQVRRVAHVLDTVLAGLRERSSPKLSWVGEQIQRITSSSRVRDPQTELQDLDASTPAKWMKIFRHSQSRPALIGEELKTHIRRSLRRFKAKEFEGSSLGADFRAILRNKGNVAVILRQMHGVGFLGRVLPEFGRLTCQVEHDLYHRYTTDEHTLLAIDVLDQVALEKPSKHGPYQKILNEVFDASSLYFALLMHDIGKGMGGSHAEKGAQMAAKAAARLGFDPDETDKIETLVRHHFLMANVSQRRDLEDPRTVSEFARTLGRSDTLNMLLLMTYADARAVGPGVWTDWKDYLLWELYYKTYERLMFDQKRGTGNRREIKQLQEEVKKSLGPEIPAPLIEEHFSRLPEKYVLYTPVRQIQEQLRLIAPLDIENVAVHWVERPEQGYTELYVATKDHPGLFAQIAGALSAFNLNILSAQLNTRNDGVVIDVFLVGSLSGTHRLQSEDFPRIERLLVKAITGQIEIDEYLKTHFKSKTASGSGLASFPAKVNIDNSASSNATVIEVQADDRVGLGYAVAKTLTQCGLNIVFAKLATEKAHVFDVFYVHDAAGKKVTQSESIAEITEQLHACVLGLPR
ncbi:MAG: [protein-PII] uridylyltransferase [Terriglobia bacterium]